MSRKNRTPEENARREKIRELLQISWLIEANGFAFFCAKLISISRIAFLLIGVSYKFMFFGIFVENEKSQKTLILWGFSGFSAGIPERI